MTKVKLCFVVFVVRVISIENEGPLKM